MGALLLGTSLAVKAQLVLDEQFNYGSVLDSLNSPNVGGAVWKRHSGSTTPIQYDTNSLNYLGYPGNLTGGAISMVHGSGSREDANRELSTPVSSGSVYVSFLLNVTNSGGATGDYAFHLNDSSGNTITSTFRAKMFLKDGSTAGKFKLGFSKGIGVASATFSSADYNTNQTYMVLVKYVFNPGSANDSVYASIIDSGMLMMEPASYDIVCTDISQTDLPKIKSVCIRQGTSGTGAAIFDGIRVAGTWADLVGVSPTTPSPVSGLHFVSTTQTTATLAWTNPAGFDQSTHAVVVFIKAGSPITQGTPDASPLSYTAYGDISLGTPYQHDPAARCVLNGSNENASISGLSPATTYYGLAYVIRRADSTYSTGATASATTPSSVIPPMPVKSISVNNTTQTSTQISWIKDSTYTDSTHTTLVFVKSGTSVILGTPSMDPNAYTADANVSGSGSAYQNDAAAKCVLNGDNDSVNISGLVPGTNYNIIVYVVRNTDTTYSSAVPASFSSLVPPYVLYNIGQINTVSPTSGLPDSMNLRVRLRGVVYGFDQLASATGIEFVLRDATGGTTVYSPSKTFGYTVSEGDSIEITGQVNAFRGLHEIDRLDTIIMLGTAIVNTPVLVTALNESTENNLVRLDSVRFATTQTGNWPSGGNVSAITALGDTITIRVLATSGLAGKPFPAAATFDVIGLGSQFTTTPANFNGYQIYPRTEDDIIFVPVIVPQDTLTPFDLLTPNDNDSIIVTNTNMTDSVYIIWELSFNSNGVDMAEYTFELDSAGKDFTNPLFSVPTSFSNVLPFTKSDVYNVMVLNGLPSGQTFAGIWRVKAESNGLERYSESVRTLYLVNQVTTGLSEQELSANIRLYPNPSHETTVLSGLSVSDLVSIVDITGKTVYSIRAGQSRVTIPTAGMPSGIYFVKVQSGHAVAIKKLIVH